LRLVEDGDTGPAESGRGDDGVRRSVPIDHRPFAGDRGSIRFGAACACGGYL